MYFFLKKKNNSNDMISFSFVLIKIDICAMCCSILIICLVFINLIGFSFGISGIFKFYDKFISLEGFDFNDTYYIYYFFLQ